MRNITVSELQKSLQSLANQKGAAGFEKAKALYLDGVVVVDEAGNPLDPAAINYEVTISPAVEVEEDAMSEEKPEETAKSVASEVRAAIRDEIAKSASKPAPKAVKVESVKNYGRLRGFKNPEEAYRFGRWALACLGSKKSAQWCADHDILVTKGHIEGVNTAGGFLVPDEFENSLITLRDQYGVFRQNARIVPMTSDVKRMPRRTGTVTANFVGEVAAGSQSEMTFDQVNLVAKKLMVLTKISSELSEDSVINLADDLGNEVAYAFALKEDQCGFNGDSTSTFGGITGLLNAIGAGGTSDGGASAASGVTLTELRAGVGKLAQWADTPNCKWYVRRQEWNSVFLRLAENAAGNMLGDIQEGPGSLQFMGYPVVLSQAITAPSGAGAAFAYFGDLSLAAYLGDRRSTTIEFSNSALNAFEQDEVVARATQRFDINVANVGDASVAGAMIKLTF